MGGISINIESEEALDESVKHCIIVYFLRLIRHIATFLAISLPGFYLAATNFHTQILPTNLILLLAEARVAVPFSSLLELLIMELVFELIREVGLRIHGAIGNIICMVGGLMIGQAAVTANIISPAIVVVAALAALGSFSIRNEELSEALRPARYGMIFLCSFLGLLGFLFGWFLILVYLVGLKTLGKDNRVG